MVKTGGSGRHSNLPPMIILHGVTNIGFVQDLLKKAIGDEYSMKLTGNDQVEIQVKEKSKFGQVAAALKAKNCSFEITKRNRRDPLKVILRNMHPSIDTDIIVKELENHGHKVLNIYNVRNTNSDEPLPLFHIELEPRENNEEIYSLTKLANMIVAFEPRYHKKAPRPRNKAKSSDNKDSSSDNAATDTKNSDKEAAGPSQSAASSSATSTVDTPVAYVQPIRSRTPKNRRQNSSGSTSSQNTSYLDLTAQDQQVTLNRLSNLESFVDTLESSVETTIVLTSNLIRRMGTLFP